VNIARLEEVNKFTKSIAPTSIRELKRRGKFLGFLRIHFGQLEK
jgi:hypothetical protein